MNQKAASADSGWMSVSLSHCPSRRSARETRGNEDNQNQWDSVGYGIQCGTRQSVGSGQGPEKRYNRNLAALIHEGKAKPTFIVSHNLPLDQAPDAYEHFDAREDGWTKVVLNPA